MLWLESERKYHNEHILSHPYFSGCPLSTINPWSFQYTVCSQCHFTFINSSQTIPESLLRHTDVIIGEPDEPDLLKAPRLKWLQLTWAGADKYARMKRLPSHLTITNASGAFGIIIRICDWHYYCTVSIIFSLFTSSGSSHLASIWQLWHDLQKNSPDSRHRRHRFFPCPPFKSFWHIHHWLPPPSEP